MSTTLIKGFLHIHYLTNSQQYIWLNDKMCYRYVCQLHSKRKKWFLHIIWQTHNNVYDLMTWLCATQTYVNYIHTKGYRIHTSLGFTYKHIINIWFSSDLYRYLFDYLYLWIMNLYCFISLGYILLRDFSRRN